MIAIFKNIKAFFTVKSVVTHEIQEAKKMNGIKPGWKTTEFWIKIVTVDLPLLWGAIHSFIPMSTAAEIELGATAVYTAGRVIVKAINDIKAVRAGLPVA